jgi:dihydrofolate reductase
MTSVQVNISMSVDGFITGPNLEEHPGLGEGGEILHAWIGESDGQKVLEEAFGSAGAVVTSRTIFDGTGGWGDEPPFKMPVFVVTHRPQEVLVKGETTFTFVTDGIEHAIAQATTAAGGKKVHVMGGASIIQQALNAGLVDELQLHVAPILLGSGTPLFEHLGVPIRLERTEVVQSRFATHLRFRVVT